MLKSLIGLLPLFCLATLACAAEPEVNREKILRLGDMTQYVNGAIEDDGSDQIAQIMSDVPPDTNGKCFITVLGMRNCPACYQLKQDFRNSDELKALVNLSSPKDSWAHFNYYDKDDRTEAWRFKSIDVGGYPTILIQLPLNGKLGKPGTVIKQFTGYDGNPKKLREKIVAVIKQHLESMQLAQGHQQIGAGYGPPPWEYQPKEEVVPDGPWRPYSPSATPFFREFPPSAPEPLTLQQLKTIVPEATADFLLEQLLAKVSDTNAVALAWLKRQKADQPSAPVVAPPVAPTDPPPPPAASSSLLTIIGYIATGNLMVGLPMAIAWVVSLVRAQRVKAHQPMILTQTQFDALQGLGNGLDADDLKNLGRVAIELLKKKSVPAS